MRMGRIGLDDDDDSDAESDQPVAVKQVELQDVIEERQPGPSRPYPPIYRLTSALDPQTLPLLTRDAWIIDIPPTTASLAVKFLQRHSSILQNRDDGLHSTRHLRSFRTTSDRTQFLLCLSSAMPDRSALVAWLTAQAGGIFGDDPAPYLTKVPVIAAPNRERLAEWQAVWPCIVRTSPKELQPGSGSGSVLLVDRQADAAMWGEEGARLRWAVNRLKRVVALARYSRDNGGVATGLHVTHPFEVAKSFTARESAGMTWQEREERDWSLLTGPRAPVVGRIRSDGSQVVDTLGMTEDEWYTFNSESKAVYTAPNTSIGTIEVDALDQRIVRRNPLKHAAIDAVSRVSVLRTLDRSHPSLSPTSTTPPPTNGSDYLLTSLSLFTLHEPCVYCTMALLHSRVREIFFLLPSPGRGACCGSQLDPPSRCDGGQDGGMYALQEQKGLNHSFTVWRWMADQLRSAEGEKGERVEDLAREFDLGRLDP